MTTVTTGRKIKALRQINGMTQSYLCHVIGLSQTRLSLVESGKEQLTAIELDAINHVFGLDIRARHVEVAFLILANDATSRPLVNVILGCLERRGEPAPVAGSSPAVVMPR